jgi:hypothetical protein
MTRDLTLALAVLASVPIACKTGGAAGGEERAVPVLAARLELLVTEAPVSLRPPSPFAARLTNLAKHPITIVLPGDGSESAMRTPIIAWSVLPVTSDLPHPEEPPLPGLSRCGNMNSLAAGEIVSLEPGESVRFEEWMWRPTFPGPGEYRVVLYYSNVPDRDWQGVGFHDAHLMARVRASTPLAVRSAERIVTVVE